ncbi:unnamed protein product, partial [Gulo gulo]
KSRLFIDTRLTSRVKIFGTAATILEPRGKPTRGQTYWEEPEGRISLRSHPIASPQSCPNLEL